MIDIRRVHDKSGGHGLQAGSFCTGLIITRKKFFRLRRLKDNMVYFNDPAMGGGTVKWDEFRSSYTGVALHIVPSENFKPEDERYNIFKAVAEKLAHDKWTLIFICF